MGGKSKKTKSHFRNNNDDNNNIFNNYTIIKKKETNKQTKNATKIIIFNSIQYLILN